MNHTVVWTPSAQGQLAELWMGARDRETVTRAADRIDRALADDPNGVGESRPDGYRILIELPLVAYYQVIEGDRMVRVLRLLGSRTLL